MKEIKKSILFIFWLLPITALSSTIIRGVDKSYAGEEISFWTTVNPITGKEDLIARDTVNGDGSFLLEFDIHNTVKVQANLEVYKVYMFVEPEKEYDIILPPYKEKSKADELNPYFNPIYIHLGTKLFTPDELNVQIRMFHDAYNPYLNKHVDKILGDTDFEQLEKDIIKLDKPFAKTDNEFFNDYRKYKYGMLRILAMQNKSKSTSNKYFKDRPFLYDNPSYTDLFNMVYEGYFMHFSRADKSGSLKDAISNKKDFRAVYNALSKGELIQPEELLTMVILKCLYDEFYDDNYSRSAMLNILSSFIETCTDKQQLKIAREIKEKVTKLLVGHTPPAFKLYDIDSNEVTLNSLKGKYVYLNFCTCYSYTCIKEFTMLQNLYEKHNQYLSIVTIAVDDDVETVRDFVTRSGYSWKFLHSGLQRGIIKDYDIRAFPTYYLIDREGKLVMSPAASPSEDFEGRLFKTLKAKGEL